MIQKGLLTWKNANRNIVKARNINALLPWMDKAAGLKLTELDAFVSGLKQDMRAVTNAFALDFSNGLAEGFINKIKVIKRIMYGRCSFKLLKQKCLLLDNIN